LALAVAAGLAILLWGRDGAEAHIPHSGLDFSIAVDVNGDSTNDCSTSGGPTTCSVAPSATFQLKLYLNALPAGVTSYEAYDAYVTYAGVSSQNNPSAAPWPACEFQGQFSQPGLVAWGCAIDVDAPTSTYLGLVGTLSFTCTPTPSTGNTVALVHGLDRTQLVEGAAMHAEGDSTSEALTINCVQPPTPTYTPTRTPTFTPTNTPTRTPTRTPTNTPDPADTDGDGCTDQQELGPNPGLGGQRDPLNPWDYFNPTGDLVNRSDDISAVVAKYGHDDGASPEYHVNYDRTPLEGANPWQFGPPNGTIRSFDVSAAVASYGHDCA
jgi:hypothetical protein